MRHRSFKLPALTWCLVVAAASALQAAPGYYVGSLSDLQFEGDAPSAEKLNQIQTDRWRTTRDAVVLPAAEAVVFQSSRFRRETWNRFDGMSIAIRGDSGQTARGHLVVPAADGEDGVTVHKFQVTLQSGDGRDKQAFWNVWKSHYQDAISQQTPGGAWFRHQVRRANDALGTPASDRTNRRRQFFGSRGSQVEDTFALMSGGRALSENLQLDRELPDSGAGAETVKLSSIEGITVREFDWEPMIKDLKPAVDPLARFIPADQHAVFLPSFAALVTLADNADQHGTPILHMAEPRAEDARSRQRYEQQLCLSLNAAARLLGPQLIGSIAMTGGDAYLRTGTDLAVVFESTNPQALKRAIEAQVVVQAKLNREAVRVNGEIDGVPFSGYRSPSRTISSYVAVVDGAVVVSNSTVQLGRIIETSKREEYSLAATPEYTFFRNRYPRGDSDETGLVILSDQTIRRWCSPKWRIGASRRTRVAAVMAELQAEHLSDLVQGNFERRALRSDFAVARGEQFVLSSGGIESEAYGDLEFQTPIIETDLTHVTPEEARLYRLWRDGYQRNWSRYFDPIAIRFSIDDKRLASDVTVMPLIDRSQYNQWIEISKGAELSGAVGDPHPEALLHWALAINPDSETLRQYTNLLQAFAPQIRVDPLSWVGNGVSIYIDEDPLLAQAAQTEDPEEFLEDHFHTAPVALHVEVRNGLKLSLFLTGLRAFIEQTVPGMTAWEALEHKGEPYVKIAATERARQNIDDREFAIYYAASGEGLTFSLNENLIKRTLERRLARRQAKEKGEAQPAAGTVARWDGTNVSLRVRTEGLQLFQKLFGNSYRRQLQRMSHRNLVILNEWKRLFPESDPVAVHEEFWQRRLVCPGGGEYVWNEELRTMESTAYGSPQNPKPGPAFPAALQAFAGGDFGVTFEEHGLRARLELQRAEK